MAEIAAYVNFDGKTRQAMEFYQNVLGGELQIQTVKESPSAKSLPTDKQELVFHASLEGKEFILMASDLSGEEGYKKGNNISLSLLCKSQQEIKDLFTNLSDSGKIIMPIADSDWNSIFGMLIDKFGMTWLLNFNKALQDNA